MPSEPVTLTSDNKLSSGTVQVSPGNATITFNRTPANATWTLTNLSIWPYGADEPGEGTIADPPFSDKSVASDGSSVSVDDDNPDDGQEEDFHYKLYGQLADGTRISSDPEIVNRGA